MLDHEPLDDSLFAAQTNRRSPFGHTVRKVIEATFALRQAFETIFESLFVRALRHNSS